MFHRGKIFSIFMKNFFSSSIFFALIISLYYFLTLIYSCKFIAICQKSSNHLKLLFPILYNSTARAFISGEQPRNLVFVKLHPHSLHLYLCMPLTLPFLTYLLLLHFLHSISMINSLFSC